MSQCIALISSIGIRPGLVVEQVMPTPAVIATPVLKRNIKSLERSIKW